jgi:hypothetical protein
MLLNFMAEKSGRVSQDGATVYSIDRAQIVTQTISSQFARGTPVATTIVIPAKAGTQTMRVHTSSTAEAS